jgi:hypothetical protein
MDWTTTYQMAAERHRARARSANAARMVYAEALHVRAVELLDAELAWAVRTAPAVPPLAPPRASGAPGWVGSVSGLRLQRTT